MNSCNELLKTFIQSTKSIYCRKKSVAMLIHAFSRLITGEVGNFALYHIMLMSNSCIRFSFVSILLVMSTATHWLICANIVMECKYKHIVSFTRNIQNTPDVSE